MDRYFPPDFLIGTLVRLLQPGKVSCLGPADNHSRPSAVGPQLPQYPGHIQERLEQSVPYHQEFFGRWSPRPD